MPTEKQRTSVPLPFSKIEPVKPVNKEFTLVKVYVCSPGKNRNMSYISQAELDAAAPTLPYIPVVGHLIEDKDEDDNVIGYHFGGHDYVLTDDFRLKAVTRPFGVVMAGEPEYETVVEFGREKTYETAYAVLWTGRYPELKEAIYSDDNWFGQSMEVNFDNWTVLDEDSNYMELHGLSYSALCILGKSDDPSKHTEPCFPSARIDPVQFSLNDATFSQYMAELRQQLSFCFEDKSSKEGGNIALNQEKINEILAAAELSLEDIDFEITEDMTEEALMAAIEEFKNRQTASAEPEADPEPQVDPQPEPEGDPAPAEPETAEMQLFSATANQKREALSNALKPVYTYQPDGSLQSEIYYWVSDFDDTHVFVERDYWTVDDYECKYGRFPYSFDEASKTASITGEFEEMVKMMLTKAEAAKVESDRAELEQLRQFKKDTDDAAFAAQVESICAGFDDLSGLDEFTALREKAGEFASLDEFTTQLFALRGMLTKPAKKAAPAASAVKVGIIPDGPTDQGPYGGLFAKFNIQPRN